MTSRFGHHPEDGADRRLGQVTAAHALAIVAVAFIAGAMNAVVGAGTLITFPTLLGLGYPALTANQSNGIGLVPSAIAGAWGYRDRIAPYPRVTLGLAGLAAVGGVTGAIILLTLPAGSFDLIVPVLLLASAVLTALQPRVAARLRQRAAAGAEAAAGNDGQDGQDGPLASSAPRVTPGVAVTVLLTGVYGGYFGAAQGVILLAALGILLTSDIQLANGVKNVLAGVANLVSAIPFAIAGDVTWSVAALIALGSSGGGLVGARFGQKLPPAVLRSIIVLVALTAAIVLLLR
jgi:uncharacterized membrane protein YfcA